MHAIEERDETPAETCYSTTLTWVCSGDGESVRGYHLRKKLCARLAPAVTITKVTSGSSSTCVLCPPTERCMLSGDSVHHSRVDAIRLDPHIDPSS